MYSNEIAVYIHRIYTTMILQNDKYERATHIY